MYWDNSPTISTPLSYTITSTTVYSNGTATGSGLYYWQQASPRKMSAMEQRIQRLADENKKSFAEMEKAMMHHLAIQESRALAIGSALKPRSPRAARRAFKAQTERRALASKMVTRGVRG
jgi:hypothetical protein